MKSNKNYFPAVLLILLLSPFWGWSQGTTGLRVLAMPGFPAAPQDSVLEGQAYIFAVTLINGTNTAINSPIDINFKVDSISNIAFTVGQPVMGVGDTVTFSFNTYNFTQPQFKAGNNIVVVWPSINGVSVPIDSFITDVFFIPLSSLTDHLPDIHPISLFPVPSTGDLFLSFNSLDRVEYVRIYAMDGKLVYSIPLLTNQFIDIRNLRKGIYFLEAKVNGKIAGTRFIRD